MIGVLVVALLDRRGPVGAVVFGRTGIFYARDRIEPCHHVLGAGTGKRREGVRIVKRTDHQVGATVFEVVEEQWRAAIGAEAALDNLRTLPDAWLAACPAERIIGRGDERGKDVARGFLAHAAMAEMRIVKHGGCVVAHGTTLAAAAHLHLDAFHFFSSFKRRVWA